MSGEELTWWRFRGIWTEDGWLEPGFVACDRRGHLCALQGQQPTGQGVENIDGYAIPGFQNAHSHAFQYAMAGRAEYLRAPEDDFWSWREAMYDLALTMTPERLYQIARHLYTQMLLNGYTWVAEFHYLHHDPAGQPYQDPASMSLALVEAAKATGIGLTLVPVYYRLGGFGIPAYAEQRRFIFDDVSSYFALCEKVAQHIRDRPRIRLGFGVHSMRAAEADEIKAVFSHARGAPCHLHIAEQRSEVSRCQSFLGKRPVRWLLDNLSLDPNCHLVHATHMEEQETMDLAASGATAVLCPTTEGNLGDGFFPLREYLLAGGQWAIGSDSHIGLSPMEELRWIDYGQRLRLEQRNVLAVRSGEDSGVIALQQSWRGGRRAMGLSAESFFPDNEPFDAVVIDASHPLVADCPPQRRLATLVYAGDRSMLLGTLVGGKWVKPVPVAS